VTASDSTELEHAFCHHPGTVTDLLESLTGEPLVADVVRQDPREAGRDNDLGVAPGVLVMYRAAVLKGQSTDVPYVYAESIYIPERLPDGAGRELGQTSQPIGRILAAHGLALTREPLARPEVGGGPVWVPVQDQDQPPPTEIVWGRSYRLTVGGVAVFAITEWFCRSVLDALHGRPRAEPAGSGPAG
jgi:chorismate-pyruvate lyase